MQPAAKFAARPLTELSLCRRSSPDRYIITTDPAPAWQWTRCFSFFGYTAAKFHVLECKDPQCYKIVEGHVLGDTVGLDENGDQWNW